MEEDFVRIPEFDLGALGGIMYISVIGKPSTQAAAASEGPSALTLATVRKDPTAILPSHSAWTRDSCPPVTVQKRCVISVCRFYRPAWESSFLVFYSHNAGHFLTWVLEWE